MSNDRSIDARRRRLLQAGAGLSALGVTPAFAQAPSAANWPTKPVTMIVPYPPGGQTDFGGRIITQGMTTALGQSIVIDNRAGAGGNIGTFEVVRAAPDGYRLLVGNSNMTINPHTYSSPSPDPLQLTPIGLIIQSALILCVHPSSPVKTVEEFIAWAKSQDSAPGGMDYASSGNGSLTHAAMELLRDRMGKPKMTHIPYKGSGPAIQDMIAGRVPAIFDASSVVAPQLKAGKLRAIMTTGSARLAAFPDVPTAKERGIKDFEIFAFIGLYGPPALPADVVRKANAALNTALASPATQKTITDLGDEVGGGTPERLGTMTRDFYKLWGEVTKANGIRAD
jgi:tripartite-type tricarboxylate transporter receptor subunit TctC